MLQWSGHRVMLNDAAFCITVVVAFLPRFPIICYCPSCPTNNLTPTLLYELLKDKIFEHSSCYYQFLFVSTSQFLRNNYFCRATGQSRHSTWKHHGFYSMITSERIDSWNFRLFLAIYPGRLERDQFGDQSTCLCAYITLLVKQGTDLSLLFFG
jgi:hypothetical protein